MTTLSERAMLTTLQISQWTARKLDRQETTALNRAHGLTVEAARVHKDLFPLATSLERVHQTTSAIRKAFAMRTLPWGIDGVSILKASAYMEFIREVNQWQDDWWAAVNQFVEEYPTLLAEAEQLLGSLFKAEDYPAHSEIARRFNFAIRFMPVPDKQDWRVDVGDDARRRLEEDITRRVQETEAAAMQEAWKRIYDVVAHAHERLRDPENRFRETLVDNAVELCGILPMLNVTDDPQLEQSRQALERAISPFVGRVDVLRSDTHARQQVTDQLGSILKKMEGLYGAA